MLRAIKAARRFAAARPWKGYIVAPFGDIGNAKTDEDIIAAARRGAVTIWHPTSTARMSPRDALWGVVDPELRVKETSGLRVVDASVFVSRYLDARRITGRDLCHSQKFP